ncbi:hypothetical protein [Paracoccus endophyticus]|uniref:hypothetical protein n=1 Tax=Paracoccus endophyticus TaxID=2233774 RepID=UPI00197E67BC|nr:hypothetical protein [Paracoccus endophyticus]
MRLDDIEGQTEASGQSVTLAQLPLVINHHGTKAMTASEDGRFLYDGRPAGEPVDFVSGFLQDAENTCGRPVGVTVYPRGAVLVVDDLSNTVGRVTPDQPVAPAPVVTGAAPRPGATRAASGAVSPPSPEPASRTPAKVPRAVPPPMGHQGSDIHRSQGTSIAE